MQQKLNKKNYKQVSLEAYGEEIRRVWGHYIDERPCLYTWLHVVEHASVASEGVRKRAWDIVLKEAGKIIIWWLAFVVKLNLISQHSHESEREEDLIFAIPFSPSQVIWSKYPEVCPVDFGLYVKHGKHANNKKVLWQDVRQEPCRCLARKGEVEARTKAEKAFAKEQLWDFSRRYRNHRPRSILKMESMFRRIFESQVYALSTEEVAFHLLEEVGEVSRALVDVSRSNRITKSKRTTKAQKRDPLLEEERVVVLKGLTEELADVFSWTMTLINRVRLDLSSFDRYFETDVEMEKKLRELLGENAKKVNVADILWRRFGIEGEFRCDECKKAECECGDRRSAALQGKVFDVTKPSLEGALLKLKREA